MISFTKLGNHGQLGNQLFEYAFLRSHAQRLGVQFYCPPWRGDTIFELNEGEEKRPKLGLIKHHYKEPLTYPIFLKKALSIKDETDILGYFQSEQYFDHSNVRKWFTFKENVKKVLDQFKMIDFDQSTSLSVRLHDDYNIRRDIYPLYPLSYYKKALKKIGSQKHILIFSDKPNRAKSFFKNLKLPNITFMEGVSDVEELFLLTQCRNNIITNSTFSWWGAWLNDHADKKVIIPKEWFRAGRWGNCFHLSTTDGFTALSAAPILFEHFIFYRLRRKISYLTNNRNQEFIKY